MRCGSWLARPPFRLLLWQHIRAFQRVVTTSAEDGRTEVFFVDPRTVFEVPSPTTAASVVKLTVPRSFLPLIASPTFELGQADDPMSSWVMGQPAEIVEYSFAGHVRTQSGWVGAITQQSWEDLQSIRDLSWETLQTAAANADGGLRGSSPGQPFLFIGQILEAASAAVYERRQGEALQGVLITTSDDEVSTP